MSAPNKYPEEPPKRQDALPPQEPSPAMSSSPEAVFMDQLYLAILDVGMYLDSRIASKYRSRTATTFSSAMQMLDLLKERRWGVMQSSGVSMWDRDIAIELRHLANDHLCVIGIIFVKGIAERVSRNKRDRELLVRTALPALLASDQAATSDFKVRFSFYSMRDMIDLVIKMTVGVHEMASCVRRMNPGMAPVPRLCYGTPTKKKSGGLRCVRWIFNLRSKKDV